MLGSKIVELGFAQSYSHEGVRQVLKKRTQALAKAAVVHGSWLNIAELEFAVLGRTVFKKRIADKEQLQRELDAICAERNAEATPVSWQFNLSKARQKMTWAYPEIIKESD